MLVAQWSNAELLEEQTSSQLRKSKEENKHDSEENKHTYRKTNNIKWSIEHVM